MYFPPAGHAMPAIFHRHQDLAKRSEGDLQLFKRFSGARWSFYNTETGNAGSCGHFLSNSGFTVAVNVEQMTSSWCGKTIRMTYGGRTTTATVQDTCPGCPWDGLDLSPGLFSFFAPQSIGIIYGEWEFTDGTGAPHTTSKKPPPPPTSTWHPPPPTTSKTHSSTKSIPKPSSTSTSVTASPIASSSSTSSINYSSGAASGLAVPTGVISNVPGQVSNLNTLNQIFVQMGAIVETGARI
ncbi:RlpA-like double-psi beta-barrel-protein domain-containing protein-containing protein [Gymnopilus junonius]|uniref:RlpA-like double-psi beta-barrel-protein domain-containing protein-containing protein n=1 Tax=Gymnopilus junonius TaxID=109634 RepID=A0A9P5NRT1_GYMJU|nr:RlpA-like double-psi beta-barrel-protein domain-containing protein-containing protein [Gymnopilus junonius]